MLGTTMKNLSIRVSQKPFIDRQKFPYGFRKSGDFSIGEADILTNRLWKNPAGTGMWRVNTRDG